MILYRSMAERVLVVDDEMQITRVLRAALSAQGYDVRTANEPEEALRLVQDWMPDLMITDLMMPGMTGIELAIRFREKQPQCRILLFSGVAATADLLDKARAEGHDFQLLAKPVHPADLLAKLKG